MCKPQKRIIASHIKIKTKMKVKNLLLAGLAVAAMTACSNDIDEIVDNGVQAPTGEQATMRINFAVPAIGDTRAVADGGKHEGTPVESAITTATIVLDYGANKIIVKDNLSLTGAADQTSKVIAASTPAFEVTAGSGSTIYAFVNPSDDLRKKINVAKSTADFQALHIGAQSLPQDGLDYLVSSIAKDNNFLMSGSIGGVKIDAGSIENTETVTVNRVSAKLDEQTSAETPFKFSTPTVTVKGDKEWLAVKFIGHSYSNLLKDSYVLSDDNSWTGENPYLQAYKSGYKWITSPITYCLENKVGGDWNSAKETATNVHYKAQVYYASGDEKNPTYTKAETFFVKTSTSYDDQNNATEIQTIYKNWADMKADFSGLSETEGNAEYLKNNDIVKFVNGECYYEAPIQHATAGCSIIRNNWYKLTVTNVKDLGWPTDVPPTPKADTKLTVKANIEPWSININNIEL